MKLPGALPVFFYCRLFGFAICFSYDSLTILKISLGELLMVLFITLLWSINCTVLDHVAC